MRLKFVLICLLFSLMGSSYSQGFDGYFGAGITASQVSGDSYAGFNRLGANLGIFTIYNFSEKTGLSLGIQFIQKGSRHIPNSRSLYNYSLRFNYFEIPIEYQFKILNKLSLDFGVSYGRLISYKETANYAVNITPYRKNEANIIIGIQIPLKEKWFVSLKYDNTLFFSPIRDHSGLGRTLFNWGQYNSVIVTTLNYKL